MAHMIARHVTDRLAQRVTDTDERASIEHACLNAVRMLGQAGVTDAAVRVWRATGKRHAQDGSNGDTAVLIVRGGQGATIMWRRASQPHTPEAYKVKRVYTLRSAR